MSFNMAELIIAKNGGDVYDTEKDLSFTSNRDCLVEMISGTTSVTTDASGFGYTTINHNLGYIPQFLGFVRDPDSTGDWYPINDGYMGSSVSADTTKMYFIISKQANKSYIFQYSIFSNKVDNGAGSGNSNVSGKLRIAKTGYNASTETDARNMRFFSGGSVYKVDESLSGTATMWVNDFINTATISHNLGYVPTVFVLANIPYGVNPVSQMLPNASFNMSYYINSSIIHIIYEIPWWSEYETEHEIVFPYKVLRDKIA